MNNARLIRLGTRGSALARWQTGHVETLLRAAWPHLETEIRTFSTRGDQVLDTPLPLVGGKGLFTTELEDALRGGEIDLAVHSLKDLPTGQPEGLAIGAIPARGNPADVLVSRAGFTLETLPAGATVGTSSRRRAAQLLYHRPDLRTVDIRGNVDTRIRKALDPHGPYDAVILAYVGLERLGRLEMVSQVLPFEQMLPAPGQGALGIQCRDEKASLEMLRPIDHAEARLAATAERAFLAGLGGGCAVPVSSYATVGGGEVRLRGRVTAPDGTAQIEVFGTTPVEPDGGQTTRQLGVELARRALAQGAYTLLEALP